MDEEEQASPKSDTNHSTQARAQKPPMVERLRTLRERKRHRPQEDDEVPEEERPPKVTRFSLDPPPGTATQTHTDSKREISRLRHSLKTCQGERDSALAHARLMAKRNADLSMRLNSKKTPRKRKITSESRFLTSDTAMEKACADREAEQQKEQKALEKRQMRVVKDDERQLEREGIAGTKIWGGVWKSRNKAEVLDLAFALGVSMSGTKAQVTERIQARLDSVPELAHDVRFTGLYPSASARSMVGTFTKLECFYSTDCHIPQTRATAQATCPSPAQPEAGPSNHQRAMVRPEEGVGSSSMRC
jgi:hypothetical protein